MTNEIEKKFFDTFDIKPCVRDWRQFNYAQVERGLKIFPERQKLADEGYIKITVKMLNPRPENDCVYWEEYRYPQITDRVLLELICILNNYGCTSFAGNLAMLKNEVLRNSIMCCEDTDDDKFKHQVRTLFEEG